MTEKKSLSWLRQVPLIGEKFANRFDGAPTVAVLRLNGVIGRHGGLRCGGLTLADLAESIEGAFKTPRVTAIALSINSPGGSPVQSALIAPEFVRWRRRVAIGSPARVTKSTPMARRLSDRSVRCRLALAFRRCLKRWASSAVSIRREQRKRS